MAKKKFIAKYGGTQAFGKKRLDQFWHDNAVDVAPPNNSDEAKQESLVIQREKKNKNKFYLIILLTLILTMSFLSVYIFELIFQ